MKCRECNKNLNFSNGNEIYFVSLSGTNDRFCLNCMPSMQPERTSEKDVEYFGMKAEIKNGLCFLEDGTILDLSQEIDVCDVPISPTKGRETNRND